VSGLILSDFIMKTVAVEYVHLSDNYRPALSAWPAPVIRKHSLHWSVSSPKASLFYLFILTKHILHAS